jgi:putative flippase GtrA
MKALLLRHQQVLVFICGGLLSAAIDVGVMQFFIMAGSPVALATTAGFASGLLVNYVFHAKVTFQRPAVSTSFVRYACLVAFNYLLTIGCVNLAILLGGNALLGKLASLPLVAMNGFLLGKYWIFK